LDSSAAFYTRKPRREHLLNIKYLGVLNADEKGETADRLVVRNTKRSDAAICIDKPEPDAFDWPYTHADEEDDLERRRCKVAARTSMIEDEYERIDEENEKSLLVDVLLKELSWEEEEDSKTLQRLSQNTLIWQCRARYAQALKYSQGCPSEFLNGPFRARLGQYISFQNAVTKAIKMEESDCSTETERWLAKLPAEDKFRVANILSEARELKLDLERHRAMKFSLGEHAKRLKGRDEDGHGGTGSFMLMYSQKVLRRLTSNPEKLRARSRSIDLLHRVPIMATEELDEGSDGGYDGADAASQVGGPSVSTPLKGDPTPDLYPTLGNDGPTLDNGGPASGIDVPTVDNDGPAKTPSENRPASLENPQDEVLHPEESSEYTNFSHGRPFELLDVQQPIWGDRSLFYGGGPEDEGIQRELEEVQYRRQHGAMDNSLLFLGAVGSGSGEPEAEGVQRELEEVQYRRQHGVRDNALLFSGGVGSGELETVPESRSSLGSGELEAAPESKSSSSQHAGREPAPQQSEATERVPHAEIS
jgi:hypothetical protein